MKRLRDLAEFDDYEKTILIHAALLPESISLDILTASTQIGVIKILQFLEKLVERKALSTNKKLGKGYYQFSDNQYPRLILEKAEKAQLQNSAKALISLFEKTAEEDKEQFLNLVHLYQISGLPVKGTLSLFNMAEYYRKNNQTENAVKYYQFILDNPPTSKQSPVERRAFIDAALGLAATREHLVTADQKKGYLKRARRMAIGLQDKEREARICMIYAYLMSRSEDDLKKVSPHYHLMWKLTQEIGNKDLLKEAALMSIDFLCWQGRIAEAVKRYEEVIGNLENLPSDEITLRACCLLGWCFSICGQTARGIGLIKTVNEKAKLQGWPGLKAYSDIMSVMTLLEARYVEDADIYLERILKTPKDNLEYFVLWMALRAKAYVHFSRKDYKKFIQYLQQAQELSERYGWTLYRGSWNLECIRDLELEGEIDIGTSLKSEIELLMKWPDIYMKGVAYRYRAEKNFFGNGFEEKIIQKDLYKSLDLLVQSGAKLEAAKTKNVIARLMLKKGEHKNAQDLLMESWEVMSPVNRKLFPKDLRKYILDFNREERTIKAILEVGNSLGALRDWKALLNRVISLIMGFTGAERGGVFLPDGDKVIMVASRNLNPDVVQSKIFEPNLKLIEKVVRSGKEIVRGIEDFKNEKFGNITEAGWMICTPITLKGNVLGVFYLDADRIESAIALQDLRLLGAITNQIAVSLDNVRAYEEISRLKDRLNEEARLYRMEPSSSQSAGEIIGKSDAIFEILAEMQKVAPTDSAVLIAGETGVGKEMIARGIHKLSSRSEGPFIPVNMASLSENLIPSELFGHERGAFTGAARRRIGRLELAHDGTLFLDDVQNIPMDIQAKLLRSIEERAFERVGGTEIIHSDFRLIAATNIPLEEMVEKGLFRMDLFYRLNVFPIHVKPLRERKEDIPPLVLHFLEKYKKRFSKDQIHGISNTNMNRLMEYPWSGNVRELKHIIERAVILSDGHSLNLPGFIGSRPKDEPVKTHLTMKEMELSHIISALEKCGWHVSGDKGAARLLDLNPQTLYSKMRKLGIKRKIIPEKRPKES
ncbi:MAG: sigma 54-interacting transcriptional regulator [Deltaproteobacteria bacterium]|nr:sigma 54-interacting transcriptional regulator [Deltaproteobacteria bacterium]